MAGALSNTLHLFHLVSEQSHGVGTLLPPILHVGIQRHEFKSNLLKVMELVSVGAGIGTQDIHVQSSALLTTRCMHFSDPAVKTFFKYPNDRGCITDTPTLVASATAAFVSLSLRFRQEWLLSAARSIAVTGRALKDGSWEHLEGPLSCLAVDTGCQLDASVALYMGLAE